jgi:hypothetical protein
MHPSIGPLIPDGTGAPSKIGALAEMQLLVSSLRYPQIDFGLFIACPASGAAPETQTTLSAEGPVGKGFQVL